LPPAGSAGGAQVPGAKFGSRPAKLNTTPFRMVLRRIIKFYIVKSTFAM